jgi:hypothetical protein
MPIHLAPSTLKKAAIAIAIAAPSLGMSLVWLWILSMTFSSVDDPQRWRTALELLLLFCAWGVVGLVVDIAVVARRLGVPGGGLGRASLALLVAMSVGGLLLRLPAVV